MSNINWDAQITVSDKLAERKAALRKQVDAIRDQMIDSGVTSNGITYQSRATDRENVAGALQLATLAASQGQSFESQWIAMDNVVHTLDFNGIVALGQAIADRKAELIFRGRQVKDVVNAAESFETLPDIQALMADEPELP